MLAIVLLAAVVFNLESVYDFLFKVDPYGEPPRFLYRDSVQLTFVLYTLMFSFWVYLAYRDVGPGVLLSAIIVCTMLQIFRTGGVMIDVWGKSRVFTILGYAINVFVGLFTAGYAAMAFPQLFT